MEIASITSLECVRAMLKLGFSIRRQHSGSVALERPGRIVVVPLGKILQGDSLALILLSARVTASELACAITSSESGDRRLHRDAITLGTKHTA